MDAHWRQHRDQYQPEIRFKQEGFGPDVYWAPHPGAEGVPIHVAQLAESLQAAEAKVASAQNAYACEKEELYTTIAILEHTAEKNSISLRNLKSELQRRTDELAQSRTEIQRIENDSDQRRETHATEISALQSKLDRCQSILRQTDADHSALNRQLLELAANKTFRECEFQKCLDDAEAEVARLRLQLDETETQHKSDVESYSQHVDDLRLIIQERDLAVEDFSLLCDRHECDADDARRHGSIIDTQLSIAQDRVASLQSDLELKRREAEDFADMATSLEAQLEAKDRESRLRLAETSELKAAAVQRELEFQDIAKREIEEKTKRRDSVIEQLQHDLSLSRERESRHQAVADSLQHHVDKLSASIGHHETAAERHEIVIDDIDRLCDQRELELTEATKHIELLSGESNELRCRLNALHHELMERQAELEDAALRRDSFHSQLAIANEQHRSEVENLLESIADAKQKLSKLQQDNERKAQLSESARLEMDEKLTVQESEFDQKVKDIRQATELRVSTIQQQHAAESQRQQSVIEQLHDEIRQSAERLRQREHDFVAERKTLEQTHANELSLLREKLRRAVEDSENLNACRVDESRELSEANQTVVRLRLHIADLTRRHKTEREQHEANESEYLRQFESMREQLASDAGKVASLTAERKKLSCQIRHLEERAFESVAARHKVESEILKLQEEHRRVSFELGEATSKAKQKQANLISLINTRTAIANVAIGQARTLRQELAKQRAPSPPPAEDDSAVEKHRQHIQQLSRMLERQQDRCQRAEFAVTQFERQIACLEESTSTLRDNLQREAAARRKAEAAIKGVAGNADAANVSVQLSAQIELDEQVKRLTGELESMRKLRAIERQQAEAEIKRLRGGGESRNRAA